MYCLVARGVELILDPRGRPYVYLMCHIITYNRRR